MVGVQELHRFRVVQFFKIIICPNQRPILRARAPSSKCIWLDEDNNEDWPWLEIDHSTTFRSRGGHKIDNLSYYCSIQRNWHHKALKRCWKAEEDHDHIGPCQAQKDCKPPHWIVSARSCFLFFLQTSLHVQGPQAALSLWLCAGDAWKCPYIRIVHPLDVREAKKRCRRLYNKFKNLDFVIDDEKYFVLHCLGFRWLVIGHIIPVIKNEH